MLRSLKVSNNSKFINKRIPQNSMTSDPRKVWPEGPINYHIFESNLGG